jgi:hypothetical protein
MSGSVLFAAIEMTLRGEGELCQGWYISKYLQMTRSEP